MRILLCSFLLCSNVLLAQVFSAFSPTRLPQSFRGSLEWGDYDHDGDYDALMTGDSTSLEGLYTSIFTNLGNGSFAPLPSTGLPGIRNGDATWADYDNDGDWDIALSGLNKSFDQISKLYENDGNNHFLENSKVSLFGCFNSNMAWGDYNKDGLLDLLLTGDYNMLAVTKIYTNKGGGFFQELSSNLTGLTQAAISWVDFNGDGYLDVYASGLPTSSREITKLYANNGAGNFTEVTGHGIVGTFSGSADWADFDQDGDPDLLITGGNDPATKLYRNTKGSFTEVTVPFEQVGEGSSAIWGDYDQDGDLDVFVNGRGAPYTEIVFHTKLYQNLGNGQLTATSNSFPTLYGGSCSWIDMDHDKDLDLSLFGFSNGGPSVALFKNEVTLFNTAPAFPTGLSAYRLGNVVTFKWRKTTDNTTSPKSITYNIRVGSFAGQHDIVNPYSSISTGSRWLSNRGNVGLDTFFVLNTAYGGPFYWSVQAIDNSLTPSAFASEKVYDGMVTLMEEEKVAKEAFYTSGKKAAFQFSVFNSFMGNVEYRILDLNGKSINTMHVEKTSESLVVEYDLSAFSSGVYLLQTTMGNEFKRHTFFLE